MSFEIPTSSDAAAREIFLEDYDEEVLDYESGKLRAANRANRNGTMPAFGLRDRIIIHTEPSRKPSNQSLHHQYQNFHHSHSQSQNQNQNQNQFNSSFQNLSGFRTTTRSNLRSFTDSLCIRPTVSQISQGIKDIMSKKPKYIRRKVVENENEDEKEESDEIEFIADERRRRRQGTVFDRDRVDKRFKAEFGFDMSRISGSSSLDVSSGCD